jgi:type IV secretion system protein TrbI
MNETVEQKAPKPPGLVPKQVQNYVILGVATVLIAIIWLTSGSTRKPSNQGSTSGNSSDFTRLNQAKLEEYKAQLAAQERLLREQQALLLGQPPPAPPGDALIGPPNSTPNSAAPTLAPQEALKTQLQMEQQKKDYQSQFANNLALSYRQELKQSSDSENFREFLKAMGKSPVGEGNGQPLDAASGIPSNQPKLNWQIGPQQLPVAPSAPVPTATAASADRPSSEDTTQQPAISPTKVADFNQSAGKNYRVLAGTVIETVLLNRINSDFSGPVKSMVTSPVYSHDRQRVLIPEGSKILGEAQKLATLGQKRVAVAFHRLIMPDGFSVSLDQFKGLNQIGETALQDKVNNHYLRIFGMSVALGLISGFSNRGVTYYGPGSSGTDTYRSGVADSLSQSSQRILDRYINILPTVTIREGHRLKVYLTNDLLLPDFNHHQMPGDLSVDQASISKEEK